MFKILLALHLVAAVFAIGPLAQAATTASRGIRRGDRVALAASSRLLRLYSYASVVVVILGFALMSATSPVTHKQTAQFSEVWIWLSLLLWAVAVGLVFAVVIPGLRQAAQTLGTDGADASGAGGPGGTGSAAVARIAAAGGVVGLIFVGIIFLMVYRPGH